MGSQPTRQSAKSRPWPLASRSEARRPLSLSAAQICAANVTIAAIVLSASYLFLQLGIAHMMWPPVGLGLAALIVCGPRVTPGFWVGTTAFHWAAGEPLAEALLYGTAETIEVAVGSLLLVRLTGFRTGFRRLHDIVAFLAIGVVLTPFVGALLGATAFCAAGRPWAFFQPSLQYFWFEHAPGALAFAAPFLAWRWYGMRPLVELQQPQKRALEFTLVSGCIIGFAVLSWQDPWGLASDVVALSFLPLIFCVWGALRFGSATAVSLSFVAIGLAAWGATTGHGAFAREDPHAATNLLMVFATVTMSTTLLAVSILAERDRAEDQRHQLELRVQQSQKLESLGLLAGGIAHDFNNLLTPILGGAGLLERELSTRPARETLGDMEQAAEQARDLCQQLLAYSGRAGIERRNVDAGQIVREMRRLLQHSVQESTQLVVDTDPNNVTVEVDVTQLRQALLNLIQNAADSMRDRSGTVELRVWARECDAAFFADMLVGRDITPGKYVGLEVRDEGHGMSADTMTTMFDPFFSTKGTGRGLGLAATLGFVRAHDGAIEVQSTSGEGTDITIWLPASSRPVDSDLMPAAPTHRTGNGTILIVDDEPVVRSVVRMILENQGFGVDEAADGKTAIDKYEAGATYDLILLDLTMPGLDGHATFAALEALGNRAPVILSSGFDENQARDCGAKHGYGGYLQKPFTAEALLARVHAAIEKDATTATPHGS
ncbi:MAG: response regulator [Planctomycetota bacterium]